MESFNSLLLKLKEVHEREVEGWQMKIQELSNKKGCDSKRMDELFSKNQQMKEQQRLLTENIKTLENRLRAGLCDRCTVTQEVAKRRQQEFEASQVQSLQHISLLASEMNILKKENKRLRDEIRSLRAALDTDVKVNSSPSPSTSSGPVSLISLATSRSTSQPAGGEVSVKTETEQRAEETEVRAWRTNNRSFESYKPLTSPTWKTETQSRAAERRSQSVEGLEQRPHPQTVTVPLKTSPSSSSSSSSSPSQGSDVTPSRHHVNPSIPCRPQPIRGSPVSIPWSLSDSSDWVSGPVPALVTTPQIKPLPPRFPNLVLSSHGRRPALIGQVWSKQSPLKPPKEPTMLFRLRGLQENQMKTAEKKEFRPSQAGEGPAEGWEGPLDLSERGTARSDASSEYLDLSSDKVKISPDKKINPSETSSAAPPSSSSSSSSSSLPAKQDKDASTTATEVSEQREELNTQTEQKKVPVLTLSLRPVVVLENLNSALHKQESSSHSKSSSAETGSSSDGQEEEASSSGPESNCQRKRKWQGGGAESDRDANTDDGRVERKIQISVRTEEKTLS